MRPRQFTDEELFATAKRCFLADGPGASTAKIASELGVSQAALFRRVGSKTELLKKAMALPIAPDWILTVEQGPDDRAVHEQLLAIAQEIDTFFRRLMPAVAVLRASGMTAQAMFAQFDEPPPVRAARALTRFFAALGEQGRIRGGNPEALAVAFLGCLQARHAIRHFVGTEYPDGGNDYLPTVVDAFVRGVAPEDSR